MERQPASEAPVFIDLLDAISSNRDTILVGKPRGQAARDALNVDAIYAQNDHVVIRVPENVIGISSSFTNGLLGNVVTAAGGVDKFLPRLRVAAPPSVVRSIVRDLLKGDRPPLSLER